MYIVTSNTLLFKMLLLMCYKFGCITFSGSGVMVVSQYLLISSLIN